ncbi:DUF1896 domain-containing protein [Chryseobacterium populi]|uniref:DUF1896 domain-containing protein n=1 Tax=Chryseobacterium populi TaxID=1144316 RepID=J2T8E0_9FLAO|nr:DUF1896 domain-containing protein [Chryseobacterium populi]EJL74357.1 Protein of unknown function (DUF1896) [Chryseobacterium populi]
MNTPEKDLSYFRLKLQELLYTSFPELAADTLFINQRSTDAAYVYQEAFRSGNPIDQCSAIADQILFEGLYFSKFDTVFQVVCQEFDSLLPDEELRPFAMKMFPICIPVFANYELTDDFAYTTVFDRLYTELTGTIQIWIDENGL